ncbi:GMC family oxidoreductase [Bordetella petrii]|uniref:GMC family oxidoreductase n=1 Tax=Bordetella petrii TaxID=94624 RepID=UPI001E387F52|nr:GMC family oxidoreductase N-terminal domain-containing protein [Bordetella petrii]MCD0502675.1 GMC family oxidoreductase N-terminal domain-containing protein [Bordetella petrii]
MTAYDYIVVGAGSAGCVLANRLSADARHTVCLLEAGPADRSPWIHLPIGYGKTMFHPVLNWGFYTDPEPGMLGRRIYWPRGRTLGGSSSINGLIYVRGQRQDYDEWREQGNPGWGWEDCLPYFRKLECNDLGPGPTRGTQGPLHASSIRQPHELIEAFIAAANTELGLPRRDDFNSGDNEGVGYYQLSTRQGLRCSAARAYLKPARRRANLHIRTGVQATRVTLQDGRATGVETLEGGRIKTLSARREVLLCAGAIQSPQLLQLSGVGPADLLHGMGIPVCVDAPGVGANLQDHLQFRLMWQVARPITTNDQLRTLAGRARIGLQWALTRSGPLAVGINQGALFGRALAESTRADVQFHVATLSADMAGGAVHDFPGCTISVCQLRPRSRGTVRIVSSDPRQAPSMQPNYLSDELDRRIAVAGVRYARRVAAASPLAGLLVREYQPGADAQSDDEILHFCREQGATIFHPSGTARMGPRSDPLAVVDARLRVHGVRDLRVVDCSVMPTLVSGNTNIPVIMIAEKAADLILEAAA